MKQLFGKLSLLTENEIVTDTGDLIRKLNQVIKPPKPVTADMVYLGVLYAASDQVNMQGGCFALPELQRLAELVLDTPVMVGHQKQDLPIGRVFKGEIVEREGRPWLAAYFYWHRDQEAADSIKAGIESGIYRECSLGFLYGKPKCSICGQDMRRCRHRVGESCHLGGRDVKAFFYYQDIIKVLEISLVYRGAVTGTRVETLGHRIPDAVPTLRRRRRIMSTAKKKLDLI